MKRAAENALRFVLARVEASPKLLAQHLADRPEAFLAFTSDRKIVAANEAAARFFGYAVQELEALPIDMLLPDRLRPPNAPPPIATQDLTTFESPGLRKDGTEIATVWIYGSASSPWGPLIVMALTDRDMERGPSVALSSEPLLAGGGVMGDLIRTKPDWEKSELGHPSTWAQSLRTSLSIALSSRFPMIIFWGEHLCVLYNDAYIPIFGAKHPEVLGKTGFEAWGEVWDVIFPMFEKVRRGEATWSEDQFLALHRRGFTEETYLTWSYSPIADEGGKVGGVFTAVQETTARVLSERRLAVLRELGERVAEAKTTGQACSGAIDSLAKNPNDVPFAAIYLFDEDGTLKREAAIGADHAIFPSQLDGHGPWRIEEALRSGTPLRVDRGDVRLPGGRWPEPAPGAYVSPISKPGQDAPYGALVAGISPRLVFDEAYASFFSLVAQQTASAISNAVAYEEERRRADALAEIDRAKTAFFSNVSHEFRTPLTLMVGPMQDAIASREHALSGEDLDTAHRNALRLLKLVNALLDFSRIEAGRMQAAFERTDLAAFTAELASVFRSAVERAGLRFVVDTSAPDAATYVDRDMWEKVVLNLLSNALKFTLEGEIAVTLRGEDDAAVLRVRDTGAGIPAAELPHLFERFHRIRNERARTHEGSGIGLALVAELVKLHGGSIHVESAEGRGTTFEVRIPVGRAHLPKERVVSEHALSRTAVGAAPFVEEALRWLPNSPPLTSTSEEATGAPRATATGDSRARDRIILADDNADMREYVARLLSTNWDVDAVADGLAALEAARRERSALILSDVMMPKLDGFGLLRELRGDPNTRTIPVILLSARAGEEATSEGLRAGASDYLVKPFSARELIARVSALLAMTKEREAERARMLSLLEQVPAIINVLRGPDLVWAFVHPKALQTMRKGRDILGKPLLETLPELRDQPYYERLRNVYASGQPFTQQEVLAWFMIDGRRVDRYWTSVYLPVRDAAGAIEGVMTFDLDVTEQVRARQELERVGRAKDEFLATMSHELRTPLSAILGWAAMLRAGPRDNAKLEHGLNVIERNARTQARLVSDLLDVSRIITGKLQLQLKKTPISAPIYAAADVVRPAAEAKRVRLLIDLDADLGATIADPERLQQVVWNLLSNAVSFTPPLGSVTVKGRRTSSSVVIEVIDTGAGIPEEHLPHIFERFRQVDSSTTRAHGGLGLGLAIVRHLVEAHGGSVTAASNGPSQGSVFTVILPIRAVVPEETEETTTTVERTAPVPSNEPTLKGVRVLLVDDDQDSLELFRVLLEGAGATVVTATNGKAALAARGPFDVIVSDIGMPEMDGYTLIRQIRLRDSDATIPGIALTAYAGPEDADRALRNGYQEHLAKPIEAEKLIAAVERCTMPRRLL